MKICGNIVDVIKKKIYKGEITITNNKITIEEKNVAENNYIIPGFIDSHIHIESSMLTPLGFGEAALANGTIAAICDPHEIGNVLGVDGIEYMMQLGKKSNFNFHWAIPSCVPATFCETSGAVLGVTEIEELLQKDNVCALGEMMNFVGVLSNDKDVLDKINIAIKHKKQVDGHAPGLNKAQILNYAKAGISSDHEAVAIDEAITKIKAGIKIQIREGSAARNFDALWKLIPLHSDSVMFCSDDLHPDDMQEGHIKRLVKKALKNGCNIWDVLKVACLNPVEHYNLDLGLLQNNDSADFIIVDNLDDFNIEEIFVKGERVFEKNQKAKNIIPEKIINRFDRNSISLDSLKLIDAGKDIQVIEVIDGELLTTRIIVSPKVENSEIVSDTENDILKVVVLSRYDNNPPAIGFIKNFNFKKGAIASSVAHDSHNIIAVGTNDEDLLNAINWIIENKGGIVTCSENDLNGFPLPVAGLMSVENVETAAKAYQKLNKKIIDFGCKLKAPFMTLSFMTLLVIPEIKIGDKGLFDVNTFSPISVFAKN